MKICDISKGHSKVFGIIGNPIEHSFSPILQTTLLRELNVDGVYVPFRVENDFLGQAIAGAYALNIEGLNVTVPHKTKVMSHLLEIDKVAKKIGAVNTLKKIDGGYKGYNTDFIGLEKTLELNKVNIENKNVVILGAGGAANSAIVLAQLKNAKEIYIVNRTLEKANLLKDQIKDTFCGNITVLDYNGLMEIEKPEIVIQTTSVGMGEGNNESPIENTQFFNSVEVAIDVIYTPWETKFLKDARQKGCIAANGFDMLIYQGVASFEIWNDVKLDNDKILELRELFISYYAGAYVGDKN